MLDYKRNRLDYGEMLIPPQGYRLAKAIAATYSLDLNTLLSIPIALFYAQTLEGIAEGERIQLLEAIQRCPDILRIYHQEGRIQVPRNQNRLYGLLEDCVVGVPPKGADSSFHPKLWILRYESDDGLIRYRLIVLSRNLTYDRSWDIAVNLDGNVSDTRQDRNQPLVDFARFLINQDQNSFAGAEEFVNDLIRVEFSPPKGFNTNFRFHPIGIGKYPNPVETQTGNGLICISPFVHDAAIAKLRENVSEQRWLFSRKEELRRLKKGTLDGIKTYSLSDSIVDGEFLSNAEDGGTDQLKQDLHAKLFVYKRQERGTIWLVGSANATKAAFERNVEFLLELRGTSDAVQFDAILDDLLGPEREVRVFEPFVSIGEPDDDDAQHALDQRVRQLEFDLFNALAIIRAEVIQSENTRNFDMLLTLQPGGATWADLQVRLAPFNSDHTPQILSPEGETDFRFENINESNLSRFLRFEILHKKELQREFLMKLDNIKGMPEGRISKIIKGIISDRNKFFEYLRFLLADDFDKEAGKRVSESGSVGGDSGIWDVKSPIFEQLLITASRRPGRLKEIDEIIQQLLEGDEQDRKEIVPQEFLTLWGAFRDVISRSNGASL